jgi:hypothetical protein
MLTGPSFRFLEAKLAELPAVEPPNQAGTSREGASLPEVIGVMLGGAEAYSLKYASGQVSSYFRDVEGVSKGKRIARGLQLVGAGVSGFAIGFYLGYSDDPNCGDEKLAEQLKETSLWRNVGLDLQQFYTWRFQRDPALTRINKIETLGTRRLTLRDAWVGVNSAIESKKLGLHHFLHLHRFFLRPKVLPIAERTDPRFVEITIPHLGSTLNIPFHFGTATTNANFFPATGAMCANH